jgi:hypothetical protein
MSAVITITHLSSWNPVLVCQIYIPSFGFFVLFVVMNYSAEQLSLMLDVNLAELAG